jgi:hypothetical protein
MRARGDCRGNAAKNKSFETVAEADRTDKDAIGAPSFRSFNQ